MKTLLSLTLLLAFTSLSVFAGELTLIQAPDSTQDAEITSFAKICGLERGKEYDLTVTPIINSQNSLPPLWVDFKNPLTGEGFENIRSLESSMTLKVKAAETVKLEQAMISTPLDQKGTLTVHADIQYKVRIENIEFTTAHFVKNEKETALNVIYFDLSSRCQ